jgi:sigma-B regulation protein RsbU (phosphoserine phosphatase)
MTKERDMAEDGQEKAKMTSTYEISTLPGLRGKARLLRDLRLDGIRASVRQRPVGVDTGDFALAHPLGGGKWLLAVGDAMGRGPFAERVAAEVRTFLRARARRTSSLGDLMSGANALVHDLTDGERYVSLLLLLFDANRLTIRIANAGHCEPLAVGRSGGVIALEGHGPALGLLPDVEYHEAGPLRLPSGVLLVATTDGATEALDAEGRPLGRDGVAHALAAHRDESPRAVVRGLLDTIEDHADGPLTDAATVLAVRFER